MVQTGMTTPYTAFAQQNGGPGAGGDSAPLKPDMKAVEGGPPGGGGGGGSPNGVTAQQALQALQQSAQQHVNGVVDQQNATVGFQKIFKILIFLLGALKFKQWCKYSKFEPSQGGKKAYLM